MTSKQYFDALKALEVKYTEDKKTLIKKYALANNKYKVGDIFKDHIGHIKIVKIQQHLARAVETPECAYYGIELKKDLTPKKSGAYRWAYQSNEEK